MQAHVIINLSFALLVLLSFMLVLTPGTTIRWYIIYFIHSSYIYNEYLCGIQENCKPPWNSAVLPLMLRCRVRKENCIYQGLSLSLSLSPLLEKKVRGEVRGSQTLVRSNHPSLPYWVICTNHLTYPIKPYQPPHHLADPIEPSRSNHPIKLMHTSHLHQGTLRKLDLYLKYSTISGV
jgi:hypothetical protein